MHKNMGTTDRVLRGAVIAPAAVVGGVLFGPGGVLPVVLYVVAAVMLGTAVVGFCPLYRALRISTRHTDADAPLSAPRTRAAH
jgi:hypothetical protein